MTSTTHRSESTAVALDVGIELSAREWWLTMSTGPGARRQRVRVAPGDRAAVIAALAQARARFGVSATAPVRSCYEAGRDGFWPHRFLHAVGVENLVVDSSSIEVPRRQRRAKTDRLDGQKLLALLLRHWGGERDMWHVVHVPSCAAEDARHASRSLTTLQRERTRYRNRIHSLLALHGVRLRVDAQFPQRLAAARDWQGEPLPPGMQARAAETWRLWQAVETERRARRTAEQQQVRQAATPVLQLAQRLTQLQGLAARSATVLAEELFSRDLRNRRHVGALTGLVSAPYRSGTTQHDAGVIGSGLAAVRRIAVEVAWAWRRFQPRSALTQWYHTRFGGGGAVARRIGIVALARRVIIALWRYATTGALPAGALLKA
jgi:transposase